jgi:hypothetical protein
MVAQAFQPVPNVGQASPAIKLNPVARVSRLCCNSHISLTLLFGGEMKRILLITLVALQGIIFSLNSAYAGEKVKISEIENTVVWTFPGEQPLFFKSKMNIDADGAPDAYHPDNIGRDDLRNAGSDGNWWALVTENGEPHGQPIVQGPNDPFPGYYISTTALVDNSKKRTDPGRYVDSSHIPFIVLPPSLKRLGKASLGDFAAVINRKNDKLSYAIFADIGPKNKLGEGSIALAEGLGIPSSPKTGGTGKEKYVVYIIFPGSGNGQPRPVDQINSKGDKLFKDWGGMDRVREIFGN